MQLAPPACKRLVTTWKESASVSNKMPQAAHKCWYVRFSIQGALNPSPKICHVTTFYTLSRTEADICAACRRISHLLWKLRVHFGAHSLLNRLLSWNSSIHWMSLLYSLILSYRLGPSLIQVASILADWSFELISHIFQLCYMTCTSYRPLFDHGI